MSRLYLGVGQGDELALDAAKVWGALCLDLSGGTNVHQHHAGVLCQGRQGLFRGHGLGASLSLAQRADANGNGQQQGPSPDDERVLGQKVANAAC
jgi:hypothetical protein